MRVWLRQTTSTAGLINGFGTTLEWENHCAECAARMSYKAAQHTPCLLTGTHVHEMHTQQEYCVLRTVSNFTVPVCWKCCVECSHDTHSYARGGLQESVCMCVCVWVHVYVCACVHVYS